MRASWGVLGQGPEPTLAGVLQLDVHRSAIAVGEVVRAGGVCERVEVDVLGGLEVSPGAVWGAGRMGG